VYLKRLSADKTFFLILKLFVLYMLINLAMEAIVPLKSEFNAFGLRLMVNIIFYSLIFFVAAFTVASYKKNILTVLPPVVDQVYGNNYALSKKKLHFMLLSSSLIGISGLLFMVFDLVVFKKINYSLGLRYARYQWMATPPPHIFSSILSKLANGFVMFVFTTIFLIILHWENIDKKIRFMTIVFAGIGALGFAAVHASRSTIIIIGVFIISSLIVRKTQGKSFLPHKKKKTDKKIYILIGAMILLIFYITILSFRMWDGSYKTFFELAYPFFRAAPRTEYYDYLNTALSDNSVLYLVFYVLMYFIHCQWTMEGTLLLSGTGGQGSFVVIKHYLHQLGIISEPETLTFIQNDGLFVAFPGTVFNDFGVLGVLFFASLFGLLLGRAIIHLCGSSRSGGIGIAFAILMFGELILSPFGGAHEYTYFVLPLIDMIIFEYFTRIFYKKSSWLYMANIA